MGGGVYSLVDCSTRALSSGYYTKSTHEIFDRKSINNEMNPHGVGLRESRDSTEHPNSLAIIIGLDVTGSMGSIPHSLVKDGLPTIVDGIVKSGVNDPQVLFVAVGDHEIDQAPFQVGQFESSDKLMDHWLTQVFLEGGGGANEGESYLLSWYFAGYRTAIDCFEKRNQKGFLFTIGDEPTLRTLPTRAMKSIFGDGQFEDFDASVLLDKAREKYHVFHIHVQETRAGAIATTVDGWKQLMQGDLIVAQNHSEIPSLIVGLIQAAIGDGVMPGMVDVAIEELPVGVPADAPASDPGIML